LSNKPSTNKTKFMMILDSSVGTGDAKRIHALPLFLATERQEVRKSTALKNAYSAAFKNLNPV
jgi:hypothetical protein